MGKGAATKQQIIDTAIRIASLMGINGLTIGELAKQVGMSKSGLFAHFGAKNQLQLDVLEVAVGKFVETVMRPAFTEPRGIPRLRRLFENWLNYIDGDEKQPGGSVIIAASIELNDQPGPLRDYIQGAQWKLMESIERAIRIGIEAEDFESTIDVRQSAYSMYSYVLGYHHFKKTLNAPEARALTMRAFEDLILNISVKN